MTEYDYSPEAYDRYLATQTRIASWVDDTETHRPEFEHALNTIAPSPSTPPPRSSHSHPHQHPHPLQQSGPSRSGSGSSGSGSFSKLFHKRKTTAPPPAPLPIQGYGPHPPAYAAAQYAMHYAAAGSGPGSSARVASRTATPVYARSVSSDEYDLRKGPGPMPITSPPAALGYQTQQAPAQQSAQQAPQQYYQLRVPAPGGYMVPAPGAQYNTTMKAAHQQQLYQPLSAGAVPAHHSHSHSHSQHRPGHRSSRSTATAHPHGSSRVTSPSSLRSPTGYYTVTSPPVPIQSPVGVGGYTSGYGSAGVQPPMRSAVGGYFVMQHPGQRPVMPMLQQRQLSQLSGASAGASVVPSAVAAGAPPPPVPPYAFSPPTTGGHSLSTPTWASPHSPSHTSGSASYSSWGPQYQSINAAAMNMNMHTNVSMGLDASLSPFTNPNPRPQTPDSEGGAGRSGYSTSRGEQQWPYNNNQPQTPYHAPQYPQQPASRPAFVYGCGYSSHFLSRDFEGAALPPTWTATATGVQAAYNAPGRLAPPELHPEVRISDRYMGRDML